MKWIAGIETFLAFTFPQTLLYTWFGFRFFGLEVKRFLPRLALFSSVASVGVVTSLLTVPAYAHPILAQVLYALFLFVFFRDLNWKYCLLLTALMIANVVIGESLMILITNSFAEPADLLTDRLLLGIVGLPGLLAVSLAAWLMQRKRYAPGKRIAKFFQEARQTPILYFVLLIFTQLAIFLLFIITRYFKPDETTVHWLLYIGIVTIVLVSFTAIRLIVKTRDEAIRATQNAYVGDLMQMFTTIRGQRHDFINHVQAMYSMLSMNKLDPLKRYMEEVVSEIQAVNRVAEQIPSTALGAFIQAKMAAAADKKIRFDCSLPKLPDTLSTVRSIDLVRIIGNLVDNAFDEVLKLPADERQVAVNVTIEASDIVIVVSNPGEPLTEKEQARMLAPGFSTKQGEHSGLGLPIVLERTRHYGGKLTIDGDPRSGNVNFTVRLPIDAGARNDAR